MRTETRGTRLVTNGELSTFHVVTPIAAATSGFELPVQPSNLALSQPTSLPEAHAPQSTQRFATASDGNSRLQPVSKARLAAIFVLALSGLSWDLWSKTAVFSWLGCPGAYHVFRQPILGLPVRFQLETTFNHGALWGMGQGQTWLFASLSFVALAVIGFFIRTGQATANWWLTIVTGLLIAGTLGNLYDRLGLHGWKSDGGQSVYAVRDFLDFHFGTFHWATFNFADTYLVAGAIMLVVYSFFISDEEQKGTTN